MKQAAPVYNELDVLFDELKRKRRNVETGRWRGESEAAEAIHEKSEPSTMPPFRRKMAEVSAVFGLGRRVKTGYGKVYKKVKGEKQMGYPNYE